MQRELYFDKLFRENFNRIVSWLFVYSKDIELSKNIAQDAFLSLWENMDNVACGKYLSYVFASARHKLINHYHRSRINEKYLDYYQKKMNKILLQAIETDTLQEIYQKEMEQITRDTIGRMKENIRKTFIMSRVEMKKNKEIAQELGVSEKLVEYRISSALRILRRHLHNE